MKKCFGALVILLVLFFSMTDNYAQPTIEPGVSLELAKWRAAHYRDVRYKLDLTLEKGAPLMRGTIEIRVNLTDEGAKNPLVLDWRTTPFADDKDQPFANVTAVNDAMDFRSQINQEHILIPNGLLKTGENIVRIEFASPIKTSGAAITRYIDKQDGAEYIYSLFVPSDASTAFPVFDQPDLKARFKLTVNIAGRDRPDWKVISNTAGKSGIDTTWATQWTFEETKPISTYVFAFAAGDFTEVIEGGNPRVSKGENNSENSSAEVKSAPLLTRGFPYMSIFVRKSQAEKFKAHSKEVFRLNSEAIKNLESYFDYKFPFPKYDLVLIPEFPFGGMEHAGATFLREASIIFPTEPTKNDFVARANLISHEAAHQWFGDTVTMKWFDDLWLKEGFAEFMAYKTLEKVLPEYNAWKIFYERNKQAAYLTDSTRGTTPIYQQIPNLSAAKSAYGNIVYRKAPSFLKQAEFYLGADKFQKAVRAFLKKHEFKNAEWTDLVSEFEQAGGRDLKNWANIWVKRPGAPIVWIEENSGKDNSHSFVIGNMSGVNSSSLMKTRVLIEYKNGARIIKDYSVGSSLTSFGTGNSETNYVFPNYQDYGYGIFLLDGKSRAFILKNIQNEKDDFLRTMLWGALWDLVREAEIAPKDFVELVIKNLAVETDESTIQILLSRVGTAMNYYFNDAQRIAIAPRLEAMLIEKISTAATQGQGITFYRAFLNLAASDNARKILKDILAGKSKIAVFQLRTKDKFDIVTRLLILNDPEATALLAALEKAETSDEAKRYAYAARAGIGTAENKVKYWSDFVNNKEISESWIEAAFAIFNNSRHADLTQPFLERALAELPNLKRNRKIFFVNGWLGSFIGGQKSEKALQIVEKFLDDNPNLDRDLRLKILENSDALERAVKIREKFGK